MLGMGPRMSKLMAMDVSLRASLGPSFDPAVGCGDFGPFSASTQANSGWVWIRNCSSRLLGSVSGRTETASSCGSVNRNPAVKALLFLNKCSVRSAAPRVFRRGHRLQVVRIDAPSIPAQVINVQAFGDRAIVQVIHRSMSQCLGTSGCRPYAVPGRFVDPALPFPATSFRIDDVSVRVIDVRKLGPTL